MLYRIHHLETEGQHALLGTWFKYCKQTEYLVKQIQVHSSYPDFSMLGHTEAANARRGESKGKPASSTQVTLPRVFHDTDHCQQIRTEAGQEGLLLLSTCLCHR